MSTAEALQTTSTVRRHYERLPFPHRAPADEANRFLFTPLDDLATLNFYCFQGKRNVTSGFRALVAGGGTGDSAIHLAEQLRGTDAEILHLDLSQPSIEIAQKRAAIRKLENITWMQGSLLDLPDADIEPFDYINCSGVLHHLQNPAEGLAALKTVLKPDGAMGLMLHGKYGRTGINQIQRLMRLINRDETSFDTKIQNTREVLNMLPDSNWFKQAEKQYATTGNQGDEELYDQFLHSEDHPFSVLEIYELLEQTGLNLVEFLPEGRALYDPCMAFRDTNALDAIFELPHSHQQNAAELFWGTIQQHEFWISATPNSIACISDADNIPFFSRVAELKNIPELLRNQQQEQWTMNVECSGGIMLHLSLDYNEIARKFINLIDGQRTIGEIFRVIEADNPDNATSEEIRSECSVIFETLRSNDLLLLRHKSVPAFPTVK